jgi:hypothetical protein
LRRPGEYPEVVSNIASEGSSTPSLVVLNPDDDVRPEAFFAFLDSRQSGAPIDPGVSASDMLREARAAGEV